MMRETNVFIADILESILRIEEFTKGIMQEEFCQNVQLQDSVARRLEIIGEAVKHIPKALRNKYPDIPWKRLAGMRDIIIHEYVGVDIVHI